MVKSSCSQAGAASGSAQAVLLGTRFPAAYQFLRMRLLDEIFPIAPWIAIWAEEVAPALWEVRLTWPEIEFTAQTRFRVEALRAVYGAWSDWARQQVFAIADRLPV